jgi:hypothetical protein
MKAIISELFFDKQLVDVVKQEKVNKEKLYNQLIFGKITLAEYLHLCK